MGESYNKARIAAYILYLHMYVHNLTVHNGPQNSHVHSHQLTRTHTHTVQVHTHAHTPWFIQAGVIGVCAQGEPVLAILRDLEGPVPQCRPAIAARVSQCVGCWDNSQAQVNCKPCIPASRKGTCRICTPCLTVAQVHKHVCMYLNIAFIHTQVRTPPQYTPYSIVQHLSITLYTTVQHLSITVYTTVHHLRISLYTTV